MQAQALARPRFRQDLVAELVEEQGQRFIDVGDPDTGNIFRFYEVEYSLACAMDGERDVAGIVQWAQEELGLTPTASEVQTVIATLADLRFIDTGDGATAAPSATAARPASPDGELARGVVVGPPPAKTPSGIEVELGSAGTHAPPAAEELPPAPALALGAPGAAAAVTPPVPPVEDIALGAPGASSEPARPARPPQSEVSIDLSAHVPVRPDDVKEAVRQSKVMAAVDVPKELLEAEAQRATPAPKATPQAVPVVTEPVVEKVAAKPSEPVAEKAAAKAPEPVEPAEPAKAPEPVVDKTAAKAPEPVKSSEPVAEAKAADKAPAKEADKAPDKAREASDKAPAKAAVEPPKRPATEKPVAPPAPRSGVSPFLVVLLILAIVGAGAFFAWKFYFNKTEEVPATSQVTPPEPPPPPPPAVVTSTVALEVPEAQEIKAPAEGTIESIEPADKDVKTGDVIARLAGGKPLEADIAKLTKDIAKLQPAVDKAEAALAKAQQVASNDRGVRSAQAKLEKAKKPLAAKHAALEAKQAELDKLAIKAVADGKLIDVVAAGDKVAADAVIAKVQREALYVATFKIPVGTKVAADGTLSVTSGDQTIVCTVIDAQAETVKVKCPSEGLAEGAELALTLPR